MNITPVPHTFGMVLGILFSYIGGFVVLKALYDFANFVYLYIQPCALHKYLYGSAPYALITGASDGIGKATAQELYDRGFNIIIHGRNESKLKEAAKEIKGEKGTRDVRIWVADATSPSVDLVKEVEKFKDVEITLVISNIGGASARSERIDEVSEDIILSDLRRNAIFPLLFTRAILPKLRSASGPAQIVYIGSFAGVSAMPRLTPYGPSKSFLRSLSGNIGVDEKYWIPTNVTTMYVVVGSVQSASHRVATSFFVPSAKKFAKALVARIGCGRSNIVAYWPQAFQLWVTSLLPDSMFEQFKAEAIEEEIRLAKKNGSNW